MDPEVIKEKKLVFFTEMFFINNYFDNKVTKIKMINRVCLVETVPKLYLVLGVSLSIAFSDQVHSIP